MGRNLYILVFVALIIPLAFISTAKAQTVGSTSVKIFGVTTINGSIVGVPATLTLMVTNGSGQVFLGSTPLTQQDTQAQAVISTEVACRLVGVNCNDYNFYYYILSSSAEVGGPSAGAAFSIAAMSVLTGKQLNKQVAMTGTANPDGSIGIVGDVSEKSEAASQNGIKVFLYPASDNVSSQAVAYDENNGMVVIPINSVYQAFQYFTGYNITPVLNYSIYTGLYNSLMESTYVRLNSYQQSIYQSLPQKNSTDPTISSLINTAVTEMSTESSLASQGDYYVSASDIISSAASLLEAKTLEELSSAPNQTSSLSRLIGSEYSTLGTISHNVTSDYQSNSSTLMLKMIALDRIAQAYAYLNDSNQTILSDFPIAVQDYALAVVKGQSSLVWVSILKQGQSNFSQSSYQNMSQYYLYKASSYVQYAGLLGLQGSPETGSMDNYFSEAQARFNDGQYVPSIFASLETIGTAQLLIEENSAVNNASLAEVNSQLVGSTIYLINTAEKSGITPFLGISYYEFGKSFANTSEGNYILFESLSRQFTGFSIALQNKSLIPAVPVLQPIQVPSFYNLSEMDFFYALLGLAIGVVISGLLFEYKLFLLVKKGRIKRHKGRRRH
ncbi:hypothetical protein M1293_03190 [Candidatus Parvarchaeota archaeon]|nr:hypothetical protein [Candidatus Parvarchaeota archaeon]